VKYTTSLKQDSRISGIVSCINFLQNIDVKVVNTINCGPWINHHVNRHIYDTLPNKYILTDPDLEFNKNLPNNFIEEMINISTYYEAEKVGFALLIDANDIRNVISFGKSIIDFEKQYWMCKFYYPKHELYSAAIDTTFCLINKNNKGGHYRIAGDYTCKHLPWHIGFEKQLVKGEYEYYNKNNISTNYWKK
jgi:hypothetical protein